MVTYHQGTLAMRLLKFAWRFYILYWLSRFIHRVRDRCNVLVINHQIYVFIIDSIASWSLFQRNAVVSARSVSVSKYVRSIRDCAKTWWLHAACSSTGGFCLLWRFSQIYEELAQKAKVIGRSASICATTMEGKPTFRRDISYYFCTYHAVLILL